MTDPKEMRLLRQKMNEERKDEMKNRISMALKDPILQQGFEIICKNLTELKKENAELKRNKKTVVHLAECLEEKQEEQLTKAKEIIKGLLSCCRNYPQENAEKIKQAEQFLGRQKNDQLAQAKELLKEVTQKYKLRTCGEKFADYQLIEQAEQFLKEAEK